jgi:hypothetical protein
LKCAIAETNLPFHIPQIDKAIMSDTKKNQLPDSAKTFEESLLRLNSLALGETSDHSVLQIGVKVVSYPYDFAHGIVIAHPI